ncbi:hypothetical protein BXZ70DRAFT_939248 [Cristinia sonorae]|uniref:Uncharacterized protein n=1 Tax=Cristinia sonorae TaxID=1940300 RepID=A0A8K0XQ96_9AGAR|nr:hypothetical protein BXZ70DRAFT_939248 [Cristinia sonorae]
MMLDRKVSSSLSRNTTRSRDNGASPEGLSTSARPVVYCQVCRVMTTASGQRPRCGVQQYTIHRAALRTVETSLCPHRRIAPPEAKCPCKVIHARLSVQRQLALNSRIQKHTRIAITITGRCSLGVYASATPKLNEGSFVFWQDPRITYERIYSKQPYFSHFVHKILACRRSQDYFVLRSIRTHPQIQRQFASMSCMCGHVVRDGVGDD